jgi:hypothetical protein
MHNWNIFGAQMNHGHIQIHKTHHNPNLGEAITFPIIIFYVIRHGAITQMAFFSRLQVKSPAIFEIGTLATLDTHNFLCKPTIEARFTTKL